METAESTPSGEGRDHASVADLLADALDLLGDHVAAVPVGGEARTLVQEVLEHALAVVGVLDLGVPLHAVEAALLVRERRDLGRIRRREHVEALRGLGDLVAVAHPDVLLRGLAASSVPPSPVITASVAPYSRRPVFATSPPRVWAMYWKP